MGNRPSAYPEWGQLPGATQVAPVAQANSDKRGSGFAEKERIANKLLNYLLQTNYGWIAYLDRGEAVSPSALTTTTNDYAPTGIGDATLLRLTTDGSGFGRITGIANGVDGQRIALVNIHATDVIKLDHQSGLSVAANRLIVSTGLASGSIILYPNDVAVLIYDGTTARWRVLGGHYSYHAQIFFPGSRWQDPSGTHAQNVSGNGIFRGYTLAANANPLALPLEIPDGTRILGYHVSVNKTSNGSNTIAARLYQEGNGVDVALSAGVTNNANNPGGITLSETSIAFDVGQSVVGVNAGTAGYYLRFLPGGATGDALYNVSLDVARVNG